MAFGTRLGFEAIRNIAFGSIGASYTAVGTATANRARIVSFNNSTDVDVFVSIDGTNDHLRVAANGFKLLDLTANEVRDDGFFLPVGTTFYVKRAAGAPASGNVWIELAYGVPGS